MECDNKCDVCKDANCILKHQLKHCKRCGELEELLVTERGAIAACPNNHYARVLGAPNNFWTAVGG